MSPSSLDSSKHNRNKPCSRRAAKGTIDEDGKTLVAYTRLYCKGWTCPVCGPKKAAFLTRQIVARAQEHGLSRFLTLTLDPKHAPEKDQVPYIREVWRKFRVYLKRETKRTVSFISVVEFHKSGLPHLHVLVDQYLPQRWISGAWSSLGGGRIVHIEKVHNLEQVGWYLGKYLTKDMILSGPKGVRRYSSSRNIRMVDPDKASGWTLSRFTFDTVHRRAMGLVVREKLDSNENVASFVLADGVTDVPMEG